MQELSTETSVQSLRELRSRCGSNIQRITLREELTSIPREIVECAPQVEFLDLSSNKLRDVPEWIGELPQLKVLFLSYNCFSEVPRALHRCRSLKMLGMRANQIEHLASGTLPQSLVWLTLTDNYLQELPDNLGELTGLRKLLLAGNRLSYLPQSLRVAANLELLRISANRFESFPRWLLELPSLAWLAISGNPCLAVNRQVIDCKHTIPWSEFAVMEELGRGASGPTYRARHVVSDGTQNDVALKVFTSSISSDGDAYDEIAAALRAGQHPNLISTRAALSGHPEGQAGLVLDLVPSGCKNLASPPSFESCTRDVYQKGMCLNYSEAVTYARGIAHAVAHLHTQGILHGDVYAHNVLLHGDRAILGDFGAACLYGEAAELPGALLERIEVRAFGIVLKELMELVHEEQQGDTASLRALAERCMAASVIQRPSFEEILRVA